VAYRVLRCFSHEDAELTVSEIARRNAFAATDRVAFVAERSGNPASSYPRVSMASSRWGVPVLALGYAVLIRQDLAKLALPHMQSLTDRLKLGNLSGRA